MEKWVETGDRGESSKQWYCSRGLKKKTTICVFSCYVVHAYQRGSLCVSKKKNCEWTFILKMFFYSFSTLIFLMQYTMRKETIIFCYCWWWWQCYVVYKYRQTEKVREDFFAGVVSRGKEYSTIYCKLYTIFLPKCGEKLHFFYSNKTKSVYCVEIRKRAPTWNNKVYKIICMCREGRHACICITL